MAKQEIEYKAPYPSWETGAYWEGSGRGELVLQRCSDCQSVQHKPRAICAKCLSSDIEHFVASGRGTVYTYTVTIQNGMPGFQNACPYVLAYVDLEEGPRLMTNITGCEPEQVEIGMAVRAEHVPTSGDLGVPRFVPA
jgi:uncharacterized OB-fold protein